MVKIFGLRITPFFLFILGLECLALLVSVYLGIMLYQDSTIIPLSFELVDRSVYSGVFLIILLSILTPGFFHQTKVVSHIKKSISDKVYVIIGAIVTMLVIVSTSASALDSKNLFLAALLSAFVGLLINQARSFKKYWRFMIRSGVN
jgi:hypothetical protein